MDSRNQPRRRPPAGSSGPNRRRRRKNRAGIGVWMVMALMVLLLAFGVHTMAVVGVGTARFYKGINLWGIDLAGKTYEEGYALMEQMLGQWKERTFTFNFQENTWTLKASDIGADLNLDQSIAQAWNLGHTGGILARKAQISELRTNPVYLTAEPVYNEEALDAFIETIRSTIDCDAVDAQVVLTAEKPELLTRSQNGYKLDTEWLEQEIMSLIKSGEDGEVVSLQVETLLPAVSSSEYAGGLELVAEVSTSVESSTKNRRANVALALSKFNGIAVYPGEQLSFNNVVGKRTKANGFKSAPEYNGTSVETGIGGGVCQASTTLYVALLQTDFEIVRRSNHGMTVGYVKPSFDAAVSDYGGKDLVFLNDTDQTYYIYTEVTSEKATVRVYGNRPEYKVKLESVVLEKNIKSSEVNYVKDTEGKLAWYTDEVVLYSEGKTGMRSQCYRVLYDWNTGEEVARELISTDSYAAQPDTYYVGVHNRTDVAPAGSASAGESDAFNDLIIDE